MSKLRSDSEQHALYELCLRLGDNSLILGHRLSEWCGHGPMLEEDIALANLSLDCIGQATFLLRYAGEVEGKGRNEDSLAYFRDAQEFRCDTLVELPRGDFAFTIARQFLWSTFASLYYDACQLSVDERLKGIAMKAIKEYRYHLRHSAEWMKRLGNGTEVSHQKLQQAIDALLPHALSLFLDDKNENALVVQKICPDKYSLLPSWEQTIKEVASESAVTLPPYSPVTKGARNLLHSEHLGRLLAEMQSVARAYPGATW